MKNIRYTYESHTTQKDHQNDGSLKILVLNQLEGLQSQIRPTLPKRCVVVASQEWELLVTIFWTTISWIIGFDGIFFCLDNRIAYTFSFLSFFAKILKVITINFYIFICNNLRFFSFKFLFANLKLNFNFTATIIYLLLVLNLLCSHPSFLLHPMNPCSPYDFRP